MIFVHVFLQILCTSKWFTTWFTFVIFVAFMNCVDWCEFQKWLITSINSDIFGLKMTSCLIEFLIKPVSKVYLSIFFQTLFMKKYFFKTFTNTFNKFLAEFNGWCSDRSSWQQNINGIPVLNILLFWISCV